MYLVVGLGNPGAQYARTRHNIGWFVLDELSRRHGIELSRKSFESKLGTGLIGSERVALVKPQTFMNLSGRAVSSIARFHQIENARILLICDDLNLPLGRLRLRAGGSDGGHNGLKSVAQMMGGTNYPRLRLGVGAPTEHERRERGTADYVLQPFAANEWPEVEAITSRAADCVETFLSESLEAAMNEFNRGTSE